MPDHVKLFVRRLVAAAACLMLALPAQTQITPSTNMMGQPGLIDMPSGDQQPDGYLTYDHSKFGPILRNSLRFQITPRLSGTFRYLGLHSWNTEFCPPDCTNENVFSVYYDRNFDVSYQILTEGRYRPALTVGLQDFIGTSLSSAEYLVATKTFGSRLKLTAGLGWGRLGSYNPIGAPFGPRPTIDFGRGGKASFAQFFRGDVAPFGGIEYQVNDKWTVKAEYSSDAYTEEVGERKMFERKSPFNFGVEYSPNAAFRFGGYYMYGSEIGLNIVININPDQRPRGGMGGPGPEPVKPRPARQGNPAAWSTAWTEQSDAKEILIGNMTRNLERTGIVVESLGVTADTAQVRYRNTMYDATAQSVGRVARAMSQVMPATVETFEIVPVDHGMAGARVVIRRSDLERLEFAPDGGTALRQVVSIGEAGAPLPGTVANPEVYPQFDWSLLPFVRTRQFNPVNPLQAGIGLRLVGNYEIRPGLILSGSVVKTFSDNFESEETTNNSVLQHVRSDSFKYDNAAGPGLETLTATYYARLAPDVYGRVSAGYLERMFGGVSAEVLYRPMGRRWALGAEANYVAQRDSNGLLGFGEYDYRIAMGHVSGYYDLGNGFNVQVNMGRYLAGDVGATLTVMRQFENGWQVGAFTTKTNISAEVYGEGSFDKGIFLTIPISWFSGKPSRSNRPVIIRPLGRDGGSDLELTGRLYEVLRSYDQSRIDSQWGRVWK